MKVSEKIALLKRGVKMSDIKELEEEEKLETDPDPDPDTDADPDPDTEADPDTEEDPDTDADPDLAHKLEKLSSENKKLLAYIANLNTMLKGSDKKLKEVNSVDVFNELFHKEEEN